VNLDLDRRRRTALSREIATKVTEHSRWLPDADRALLNWVYRSARPLSELAATGAGAHWVLRRKLQRIVARVLSREYRHVAMLLSVSANPPEWPPVDLPPLPQGKAPEKAAPLDEALQLAAARAMFINGLTVRETARVLGISRQRVARLREIVVLQATALVAT
jgi:hypothetical protein